MQTIGNTSPRQRLRQIAQQRTILRPRDLQEIGIPRTYLARLCEEGTLQRAARGIYVLTDAPITQHHDLAQVARRVPHGVVALLSALAFHGIGTQLPARVHLFIERDARMPRVHYPPILVFRTQNHLLHEGVQTHLLEGVPVPITDPARTLVDCFKFRNKIGLDVALEALKDGWRQRAFTMDQVHHFAQLCRMTRVMQPYLQAVLA